MTWDGLFEYPNGAIAQLYPVAQCNLSKLERWLNLLQHKWVKEHSCQIGRVQADDGCWQLVSAAASIIRSEPALPFVLEPLRTEECQHLFASLFLAQIDEEGSIKPAQLWELHQYESRPRRQRQEGEPVTVADLPFPTSGDREADTVANLMNLPDRWGLILWNQFDAGRIDKILQVWGELNRNPDDRVKEYVAELFAREMQTEEYQRSMLEDWG